jgi:hypothetical protein
MVTSEKSNGLAAHIAAVVAPMLARARARIAQGDDAAAQQIYLDILRLDPTHRAALLELGVAALGSGHRAAARTLFSQAAQHHPDDLTARVTLGNMALEDDDLDAARAHYQEALERDPSCAQAYQGMARVLTNLGNATAAEPYWEKGFAGNAMVARQYRGAGAGIDVLYLVAARGGNVRLRPWMDDRVFATTVLHAEYFDPDQELPPHLLVVNAIGDADLGAFALTQAQALLEHSTAPVINPPEKVRATGRAALVGLCAGIEGLVLPQIRLLPRAEISSADLQYFPLLLRSPGFHTGQHFVLVEHRAALAAAIASLPGDALFAIDYLDARGRDGMARKYRVMFIEGVIYPWHLAISPDWKVHYYTAAMETNAAFRAEEQRFLEDMPGVLGARAMAALSALNQQVGLDFAGADFALSEDGSVLLFEANATMVINAPPEGAIWDYRRRAAQEVQGATRRMILDRARINKL